MKRVLAWIAGALMVALAAVVGELALTDAQQQASFVVPAVVGERVEGRTIAVTIRQVRAADELRDARGWQASGSWVVVDLDAEALQNESGSILSLADLDLGDRTVSASERPESLATIPLALGLSRSGSLAFELPAGATGGTATLRLGRSEEDRLDSVVELPIDLGALERLPQLELEETRWTG